jgi:hypothetical protein
MLITLLIEADWVGDPDEWQFYRYETLHFFLFSDLHSCDTHAGHRVSFSSVCLISIFR